MREDSEIYLAFSAPKASRIGCLKCQKNSVKLDLVERPQGSLRSLQKRALEKVDWKISFASPDKLDSKRSSHNGLKATCKKISCLNASSTKKRTRTSDEMLNTLDQFNLIQSDQIFLRKKEARILGIVTCENRLSYSEALSLTRAAND